MQGVRGPEIFMDYMQKKQTSKTHATFTIWILRDILLTLLSGVKGMYVIMH